MKAKTGSRRLAAALSDGESLQPHAPGTKEGLPEKPAGASDRLPCGYGSGEERAVPTAKFITLKSRLTAQCGQRFRLKTVI